MGGARCRLPFVPMEAANHNSVEADMTQQEEQLLECVELLYGWVANDRETTTRLVEVYRVVEPMLHKYESAVLRRVMKQRVERREVTKL